MQELRIMKTKEPCLPARQVKAAERGQVMLEAVVALTLLTIGMLGIFTILSNSIAANRTSTNQEIAVNLAAEGIEVVKSMIDANHLSGGAWNAGLTGCPSSGNGCRVSYCTGQSPCDTTSVSTTNPGMFLKYDSATNLYSYGSGMDTIFSRVITIDASGSPTTNRLDVISTVSWTERNNKSFSVILEDRFYDWRP